MMQFEGQWRGVERRLWREERERRNVIIISKKLKIKDK